MPQDFVRRTLDAHMLLQTLVTASGQRFHSATPAWCENLLMHKFTVLYDGGFQTPRS